MIFSAPPTIRAMRPQDVRLPAGAVPGYWLFTAEDGRAAVAFATHVDELRRLARELIGDGEIWIDCLRREDGAPL